MICNRKIAYPIVLVIAISVMLLMLACQLTDDVVERSQDKADAQATYATWGEEWQSINSGDSSVPVPTRVDAKEVIEQWRESK